MTTTSNHVPYQEILKGPSETSYKFMAAVNNTSPVPSPDVKSYRSTALDATRGCSHDVSIC